MRRIALCLYALCLMLPVVGCTKEDGAAPASGTGTGTTGTTGGATGGAATDPAATPAEPAAE
ncbi:MAG TPA: hypothetical protein VEQ85_01685 [Lacipirellulaceae bacterium]|nr:hypothetical protein [Lacipirellulaceae bacterium]